LLYRRSGRRRRRRAPGSGATRFALASPRHQTWSGLFGWRAGLSANPLRDALDRRLPQLAGPCSVVLMGVTGDLSRRKLIPAIYDLANRGLLPPALGLVCFGRVAMTTENFAQMAREAARSGARTEWRETVWQQLYAGVRVVRGTFDDPEAWQRLASTLHELDATQGT